MYPCTTSSGDNVSQPSFPCDCEQFCSCCCSGFQLAIEDVLCDVSEAVTPVAEHSYQFGCRAAVGTGEGTDNLDFLPNLSTLDVIDPDSKESKGSCQQDEGLILEVPIPLLDGLNSQDIPYAQLCMVCCAVRLLESHYLSHHNVLLQASCCFSASVFQTVRGMELQLRQSNFGSYSTDYARLREDTTQDTAKEIIGAYCITKKEDDSNQWLVKVPGLKEMKDSSLVYFPSVTCVPETEADLQE